MAKKPWHRNGKNTNETKRAYELFKIYLKLEKRTAKNVASEAKTSVHAIRRHSAKHQWQPRAEAFDNFLAEKFDEELTKVVRAHIAADSESLTNRMIDGLFELEAAAEKMIEKLHRLLDLPVTEVVSREPVKDAEGNPVIVDGKPVEKKIVIKPVRWSGSDIRGLAETGVVLQSFVYEQMNILLADAPASSAIEKVTQLPPPKPLSEMTAEEKLDWARKLREASERVSAGEAFETVVQEIQSPQ